MCLLRHSVLFLNFPAAAGLDVKKSAVSSHKCITILKNRCNTVGLLIAMLNKCTVEHHDECHHFHLEF